MQILFKSVTKFVLLSGLSLLLFNCNKDDNLLSDGQQITSSEVKTILETDVLSGAVDQVIAGAFNSALSGKSYIFDDCHVTEITDTGFNITFDGCSYDGGKMITGSVNIVYVDGQEGSFTATYENLMVGDYNINGTRDFAISGDGQVSLSFTVTSNITIELDGSTIEETGVKVIALVLDFSNLENVGLSIDGDWTVKADGNIYVINITSPLEVTGDCDYVVKGIMQLNKNGLKVDVDFGDGTCDDIAKLTYPNGTEEEISLKD